MLENVITEHYVREVMPVERLFSWSPFSIVTLVARIKGQVSESALREAVAKAQRRHLNLQVRIMLDPDGNPWFTSEQAAEIPIKVVARRSADQWIQLVDESSRVPFQFDERPAVRFILVKGPEISELIILCFHILCDGLSLAYLARDLMVTLGDPLREVETLPDPVPITPHNIPQEVSLNPIAGYFIGRMNKKWEQEKVLFDQLDYEDLTAAYWMNYTHQVLPVELSEAQTEALVARCRKEEVTVNSALSAAFIGAQVVVQGEKPFHATVGVAASLRDRLPTPAGESMGFFAGVARMGFKYKKNAPFWDNARWFQRLAKSRINNKNLFQDLLTWCYLEPSILESLNFKRLGSLVPPHCERYQKLHAFSQRDDVVLSILKRGKMDSLERIIMGTAVTNLTRMDFPRTYGDLELDRLIMKPGGAFPMANANLVLGAVTCCGKLSLLIEYVEDNVDTLTMERIKDAAMDFLLSG
jgi:hypothetical protein